MKHFVKHFLLLMLFLCSMLSLSYAGTVFSFDTSSAVETDDDPCDLPANVNLFILNVPCNQYMVSLNISPGYQVVYTQWTVDGNPVNPGPLNSISLGNLSPGTHTVCAFVVGGPAGQDGNLCCDRICTVINVPEFQEGLNVERVSRVIEYCPLSFPLGPWYEPCTDCAGDYFEFYKNGTLQGTSVSPGCIAYKLDGPSELKCYDVLPSGVKCLKKVITFSAVPKYVWVIFNPTVLRGVCHGRSKYTIDCAPPFSEYKITGPGLNDSGSLPLLTPFNLVPGTYEIKCIDYVNCRESRTTVVIGDYEETQEHNCEIELQSGCHTDLDDPQVLEQALENCPDCQAVAMNATAIGPWEYFSYDAGTITMQRVYEDALNCARCTLKVKLLNRSSNYMEVNAASGCALVTVSEFPACLQNLPMMMRRNLDNGLEYVTAVYDQEFCCVNGQWYMLYDPNDPCCFLIIKLICPPSVVPPQNINTTGMRLQMNLKIVPNPSSSVFRIESETSQPVDFDRVQIVDVNGKAVLEKTNISSETLIDMSAYSAGTYFIKIVSGLNESSLKLMLVKP